MPTSGPPYPDWRDPSWPWMAKLARAKHHIDTLRLELADFEDSAYSVSYDPGNSPTATAIRLHISKPIPLHFSTMIGDAVHNMRSALDALAYELARRHVGGTLTPEQERKTAFPFFEHRADFDKFFERRADIYGPPEKEALDSVAPGWLWDGMDAKNAQQVIGPREKDVTDDALWKLNELWNIDKHRRLHFTVWWPDDIYWVASQGEDYDWIPGSPPWEDGAIIGTIVAPEGKEPIPGENVTATFELRMVEEGVNSGGIADGLAGFYGSLAGWTLPRAFMFYEAMLAKEAQEPSVVPADVAEDV